MINTIQGIITEISEQSVVIDIGPLSLSVFVPSTINFSVGKAASLATYLHWTQEQGPSLFGFSDKTEKAAFLLLTSCPGVGPKLSLAAIGHLGAPGFLEAISSGNDHALAKVSGIGPKKAEQIIVQLKHKVTQFLAANPVEMSGSLHIFQDVACALESLNYSRQEINHALNYLGKQQSESSLPFDQLFRQALSFLAKR